MTHFKAQQLRIFCLKYTRFCYMHTLQGTVNVYIRLENSNKLSIVDVYIRLEDSIKLSIHLTFLVFSKLSFFPFLTLSSN